jgi:hypothetical protein
VAPGSTEPLTEMSTRNPSWGKDGRCVGLTTLPPSSADCLEILGASSSRNPKGLSKACSGKALPFYINMMITFGLRNIYRVLCVMVGFILGTALPIFRSNLLPASALKMEAVYFSETTVTIC